MADEAVVEVAFIADEVGGGRDRGGVHGAPDNGRGSVHGVQDHGRPGDHGGWGHNGGRVSGGSGCC